MTQRDLRLRNLFWLRLYEGRQPDPVTGQLRAFSVAEIALLAEKNEQTVRNGIASARGFLEALGDALDRPQSKSVLCRARA